MKKITMLLTVALLALASLSGDVEANTNWKTKFFTYADFSEADGSTDADAFLAPGDGTWYVQEIVLERVVDFSRGGDQASNLSAVTLSLGDAGSATRYMAASDIWTGAKATATYTVGSATASTYRHVLAAGAAIKARVATTGANTNQLTAGKFAVHVLWGRLKGTGY